MFFLLIRKQFFSLFFQIVKSLFLAHIIFPIQKTPLSPPLPKKYLSIFSRKNKFTLAEKEKRKKKSLKNFFPGRKRGHFSGALQLITTFNR